MVGPSASRCSLNLIDEVGGSTASDLRQQLLAVDEARLGEVVAVAIEEIEREIAKPVPPAGLQVRLQMVEIGDAAVVLDDDLAVDQGRAEPELGERVGDAAKARRPVEPVPCQQPHLVAVDARLDAIAVVLDLVNPVRRRSAACRTARRGSARGMPAAGLCGRRRSCRYRAAASCGACRRRRGALWSSRSAPAAASSSLVCPLMREVVSSSVISGSPAWRANSSSALMSSHGSDFSPRRGFMRTRCHRPLSRAPSRANSRWPLARPLWGSPTGVQRPRSHTIIEPPPYSPFGNIALEVQDTRSDGPRCAPQGASRPASGSGRG